MLKSEIEGMPDGEIRAPKKPVTLTFKGDEALLLYTSLEALVESLHLSPESTDRDHLISVLDDISARLLDRLEVSFS